MTSKKSSKIPRNETPRNIPKVPPIVPNLSAKLALMSATNSIALPGLKLMLMTFNYDLKRFYYYLLFFSVSVPDHRHALDSLKLDLPYCRFVEKCGDEFIAGKYLLMIN